MNQMIFRNSDTHIDDERRNFSGYGVVFHSDSVPMYVFHENDFVQVVERITPESVKGADMTDVIAAYNHNFEKIMGRTSAGTLSITTDERGIKYAFSVPETTFGNDLLVSTKRGDIRGSSFVFTMDFDEGYDIQERDDGKLEATPRKITKIYEMGPVVNPAYPETTAENRSSALADSVKKFFKRKEAENEVNTDDRDREIELLRMK